MINRNDLDPRLLKIEKKSSKTLTFTILDTSRLKKLVNMKISTV